MAAPAEAASWLIMEKAGDPGVLICFEYFLGNIEEFLSDLALWLRVIGIMCSVTPC